MTASTSGAPVAFDEMRAPDGAVRDAYSRLAQWLENTPPELLARKRHEADVLFRRLGITFAVYGEGGDTERLIPFDVIPRVLTGSEWNSLSEGLVQRVKALNAFLYDVYHAREIVRAGKIPAELIDQNEQYRPEMVGVEVPGRIYTHIAGIDVVRVSADQFYVLEDNVRTPSGVSYMLENREAMMRLFPELFARNRVQPVGHYPDELLKSLRSLPPAGVADKNEPTVVVMTPGAYNSAYFEHVFLAEQMGVELVEGQDLFVENDMVYMRTVAGPRRVEVIYRRLDDARWACAGCSRPIARATSPSPTRWARAWPTTNRSILTSPTWCASISARSPSSPTCPPIRCASPTI